MLVLVALLMPVILGAMGLAVDLGLGFASRRMTQNTADAASYGATLKIAYNDPSGGYQYKDSDIYNVIVDVIKNQSGPQAVNLYTPPSGAVNTIGTADVWAQFVGSDGSSLGYLQNDSSYIPTGANGLRVHVSWPQRTYFGAAVGWGQYVVSGTAAYLLQVVNPNQVGIAPFIAWWDPQYGPQPQATTAATNLGAALCSGNGATKLQCVNNPLNGPSHPNLASPYGPPDGTPFVLYSTGYANADPNDVAGLQDPNYQLGSNDFKGYVGYVGAALSTCLQTYVGVNGNGQNGQNAQATMLSVLTPVPSDPSDPIGVAWFGFADQANKPGGNVQVFVYGTLPLAVHYNEVNQKPSGPYHGYVYRRAYVPNAGNCGGSGNSGGKAVQPVPLQ